MTQRDKSWQIAADLETAAKAVLAARKAIIAVHSDAQGRITLIDGMDLFHSPIASELQALSDEYQAIADAEPDDRTADELRTGYREEDFA